MLPFLDQQAGKLMFLACVYTVRGDDLGTCSPEVTIPILPKFLFHNSSDTVAKPLIQIIP